MPILLVNGQTHGCLERCVRACRISRAKSIRTFVPAFTGLLLLRGRYSRKGYHIILEWGDLGISKLIYKVVARLAVLGGTLSSINLCCTTKHGSLYMTYDTSCRLTREMKRCGNFAARGGLRSRDRQGDIYQLLTDNNDDGAFGSQ
jgi:hypothetical protein